MSGRGRRRRRGGAAEARLPTPYGPAALLEVLDELAGILGPFDSFGVGAAGLVTIDGVWRAAPNVGGVWDFPILDELVARFACPVRVDNDATCATLAEWQARRRAGSVGRRARHAGHRHRRRRGRRAACCSAGANGFAGEPGHMVVDPNGPPCPCGRRGCWERFASGSGSAAWPGRRPTAGTAPAWSRWPAATPRPCAASTCRGGARRRPRRAGGHRRVGVVGGARAGQPRQPARPRALRRWAAAWSSAVDLVLAPDPRRRFADLLVLAARATARIRASRRRRWASDAGAIGAALTRLSSVRRGASISFQAASRPSKPCVVDVLPGSSILYTSKKCSISASRLGRRSSRS